jgi:hypothetical protein
MKQVRGLGPLPVQLVRGDRASLVGMRLVEGLGHENLDTLDLLTRAPIWPLARYGWLRWVERLVTLREGRHCPTLHPHPAHADWDRYLRCERVFSRSPSDFPMRVVGHTSATQATSRAILARLVSAGSPARQRVEEHASERLPARRGQSATDASSSVWSCRREPRNLSARWPSSARGREASGLQNQGRAKLSGTQSSEAEDRRLAAHGSREHLRVSTWWRAKQAAMTSKRISGQARKTGASVQHQRASHRRRNRPSATQSSRGVGRLPRAVELDRVQALLARW